VTLNYPIPPQFGRFVVSYLLGGALSDHVNHLNFGMHQPISGMA